METDTNPQTYPAAWYHPRVGSWVLINGTVARCISRVVYPPSPGHDTTVHQRFQPLGTTEYGEQIELTNAKLVDTPVAPPCAQCGTRPGESHCTLTGEHAVQVSA